VQGEPPATEDEATTQRTALAGAAPASARHDAGHDVDRHPGRPDEHGDDPARRRVRRIFAFLRAFAQRRAPDVRAIGDVPRRLRLRDLPEHSAVRIGSVSLRAHGATTSSGRPGSGQADDDEDGRNAEPLLRIRRPTLTKAPSPPDSVADWVLKGWEKPEGKVAVWNLRNRRGRGGRIVGERFADEPSRTRALAAWSRIWSAWSEVERPAREAMRIFETLYALHGDIERQGERIELMLGDGRLLWRVGEETVIDHPVLLQRVDLVFDPDVPEFRVVDSDRAPELHSTLLLAGGSLSGEKLNELTEELEMGGYHPLAGEETSAFLRRVVSLLGPGGVLRDSVEEAAGHDGPVMVRDAWLFARDRSVGFGAAFDRVLEDLDGTGKIPASLERIVGLDAAGGGPAGTMTPAIPGPGAPLPDLVPEATEFLLSKPANAEQIEIVRALEAHQAVLVQGPPGTGKSHTIANLIGHLVAQGKRVLVTSYTTKALRVLRDQIVDELRPLCVSVLDNDLEGRTQMEQAVRGIVHRLSSSSEERLGTEAQALQVERQRLAEEITRLQDELREAREGEYRPIVVGDEEVSPADAARHVEEQGHRLGFLPGPLPPGSALPMGEGELRELYASNDQLSADNEEDLAERLPDRAEVPSPAELRADVELIQARKPVERGRYWQRPPEMADTAGLDSAGRGADQLLAAIAAFTPWQRQLVAAGRVGSGEEEIWRQLAEEVKRAAGLWQGARPLLLEHAPTLDAKLSRPEAAADLSAILSEIQAHLLEGGTISGISMLLRSRWRTVIDGARVNGKRPSTAAEFAALQALTDVQRSRSELGRRWARQAVPAGLPALPALPDPPEPTLAEYVEQFERLLVFWNQRFGQLKQHLQTLGFAWDNFRADELAKATPSAPLESDLTILGGPLKAALAERAAGVGRLEALGRLKTQSERLGRYNLGPCRALAAALGQMNVDSYERELRRLEDLWRKVEILTRRRELLRKLGGVAPEWAAAVERRRGIHGALVPPRDLPAAWRWRQLEQELEKRGARDERDLARRLEGRLRQLRALTVDLVDRRAWLAQLRRTDLPARQALIGWADTQRKIGKGTGKRAPALQRKARELLTRAREAVPVWIMPLSRVAESFDPRHGKFDVVIVDEASQCDLAGLFALYLGKGAVIVGDHEQVSPSAIGETVEDINALISQHLAGIPNSHLYDGQTSVYDLARQSFGGTIGLREHFRCVPDIIEFSNKLSYHGEIRPLRDPNTARRPHTVEYPIPRSLAPTRRGKVNEVEARTVAALCAAAMQLPEYEGKTFGAISLLGDEQAAHIQSLMQILVPLHELQKRRFVAGNPAQFQGDERDIVLLSMVDVPEVPSGQPGNTAANDLGGTQALPMQERLTFKQRYNVASSRAKDQLWLVHSLDPRTDLQPGDLRRHLIEHIRDPGAHKRATAVRPRAQSAFEEEVLERLRAEGFRAEPQGDVGGHALDIVVSDGARQVAVECDGDRPVPVAGIPAAMARQAVLERVGWRFLRVRATRFFRDRDGTMESIFADLRRLGMGVGSPGASDPAAPAVADDERTHPDADPQGENLRNKVVRRAWQIMREHDWIEAPPPPPLPSDRPTTESLSVDPELMASAQIAELVLDDTTEPNFVILEQWESRPDES
jgi:very-short-patch-repair endonuclease